MIFTRNSFIFGCVILLSVVLLNDCVCVALAYAQSHSNEVTDAPQSPPPNTTTRSVYVDGEYNVNVRFNDKVRHVETGEYEMRNGRQVFVVRGFFQYFSDEGKMQIVQPYIFDNRGYHEIQVPNVISIRYEDVDTDCDLSTGHYCIDPKLLRILVG